MPYSYLLDFKQVLLSWRNRYHYALSRFLFLRYWGMKCEIDDRLTIMHPKGDVHKNPIARNQARAYLMRYPEGMAIRRYWVACSLRNAGIQLFILPASYRKWLKIYLPFYRFFHRR